MGRSRACVVAVILALESVSCQAPAHPPPDQAYRAEIRQWRREREDSLTAKGGWLAVAGLFWLEEGSNVFGSDPACDIVLPEPAPPRAGVFELRHGRATVHVEPGVEITADGEPITRRELRPDTAGSPTVLSLGELTLQLIQRQEKFGIRLRDPNNPRRRAFAGLEWFPVREGYRVRARFVAHDEPRHIPVANVLGQVNDMESPGDAVFGIDGEEVRLHPVTDDDALFFIFRDATAPEQTYGAGRFLYSERPRDGFVVLDFNKAYSPPCAFTDFATCPLPPKENHLSVRIEAGERKPKGSH